MAARTAIPKIPSPTPPSLHVSLEMVANLIYLADHSDTHSAKQHALLEWAATIIYDLRDHPKVCD